MRLINNLLFGAAFASQLEKMPPRMRVQSDSPVNVEVIRVSGQDQCEEGLEFNQEACACFQPAKCKRDCGEFQILDPRELCTCISEVEYEAIFTHNLTEECKFDQMIEGDDKSVTVFNFYGEFNGNIIGVDVSSDESLSGSDNESDDDSEDNIDFYEYFKPQSESVKPTPQHHGPTPMSLVPKKKA